MTPSGAEEDALVQEIDDGKLDFVEHEPYGFQPGATHTSLLS